jgi:tetratricopeptide (TPR) repeat protein
MNRKLVYLKPRQSYPFAMDDVVTAESKSETQVAPGNTIRQKINIDRPGRRIAGTPLVIERVEQGATLNITIIDYQDGLTKSANPKVKNLFKEGQSHFMKREWTEALDRYKRCLDLEKDFGKLSALDILIGNCYFERNHCLKAAEYYAKGLRNARKAKDREGEGRAFLSIGNTYIGRPVNDRARRGGNIRRAIELYEMANRIFLKDEDPVDYAVIQNNLGVAYMDLPAATAEQRAQNVRQAVECYKAALEIRRKDEYPIDYAVTQNNLGNAYKGLPAATPEQRAQNVSKAVECYRAALEIRRKDEYPIDYAVTQNNLGNAYKGLPAATPEQRAQNVRQAVECYRAALEIRRKDKYPVDYAMTQNNLGVAYMDLSAATAEQRAQNVRKALECYRAALKVRRKDKYPREFCYTAANMGMCLASINRIDAFHWLIEAYSLRQYLPDQGNNLKKLIMQFVALEL